MVTDLIERFTSSVMSVRARRLARDWSIAGKYRRVYHYHVRKTAGTSLNSAFWGLGGLDLSSFPGERAFAGKFVFVRHDRRLIEEGAYFFANSHFPAHTLSVPADTFTVTVLRDPLKRLVSYYRHLVWARDNGTDARRLEPAYSVLLKEMQWLGNSFGEFLELIPEHHLLAQLYMFSASYDVDEALERVGVCDAVCLTECFGEDMKRLARELQLPLEVRQERRFGGSVELSPSEEERAREKLAGEFEFIQRVTQQRLLNAV